MRNRPVSAAAGSVPRERHLTVPRTARYYVSGDPGPGASDVWFVCHGYGQLAGPFLAACRALEGSGRVIVAPEGLSRYYTDHGAGAVGASWMTREHRRAEIADYVRYLDAVAGEVLAPVSRDPSCTVLGFSQGAATACRWAALGKIRVRRLVLWGGGVPPDLDLDVLRDRLDGADIVLVVGSRDRYVSPQAVERECDRLADAGLSHRLVTFEGGHRLDDAVLAALASESGRT